MLDKIFIDIQNNKKDWLKASTGEQFEQRFEMALKKFGYNRINKEDVFDFNKIKNLVLEKKDAEYLENPFKMNELQSCFIYQPFGSQNYPDFLIFSKGYILPIEIKYSQRNQSKPIWNSNLPKANGFYIFGSFGIGDVTFFMGCDVLPKSERNNLIDFFEEVKKEEESFKEKQRDKFSTKQIKQDRGFTVYIRRAFDQGRTVNKNAHLNYFTHPERVLCEKNLIERIKELS